MHDPRWLATAIATRGAATTTSLYTEPARSCITYMAGMVVFGGVMGDAAIVDTVISEDCVRAGVAGLRPAAARVVGAGRRQGDVADTPDQRDVEGLGGQFWYEARMGGGP